MFPLQWGMSSIPGQGPKILTTMQCHQKKKKNLDTFLNHQIVFLSVQSSLKAS